MQAITTIHRVRATWKRLIALLMLVSFVPMAGLGAPQLVLCIGEDGHAGIETVSRDGAHSGPGFGHQTSSTRPASETQKTEFHPLDCIDQPIVLAATISVSQTVFKSILTSNTASVGAAHVLDKNGIAAESYGSRAFKPRGNREVTQLAHLTTIILLI